MAELGEITVELINSGLAVAICKRLAHIESALGHIAKGIGLEMGALDDLKTAEQADAAATSAAVQAISDLAANVKTLSDELAAAIAAGDPAAISAAAAAIAQHATDLQAAVAAATTPAPAA